MGVSIPTYKPGDRLQADTINQLIRNSGVSSPNSYSGGGANSIMPSPLNEQSMADLTQSNITEIKAHSVVYCTPMEADKTYLWTMTKRSGSQAYFSMHSEIMDIVGTDTRKWGPEEDPNAPNPTANSMLPPIAAPTEGKRMIALEPMVPGKKYVLRSQTGLNAGDVCAWNGDHLVLAANEAEAEFIVQKFQWIETPPSFTSVTYPEPLFDPARLTLAPWLYILHEVEGWMPRYVTYMGYNQNTLTWELMSKWLVFADNMFPDNIIPGFPELLGLKEGYAVRMSRPADFKNPAPQGFVEAVYKPTEQEPSTTGTGTVVLPVCASLVPADVIPRPTSLTYYTNDFTTSDFRSPEGYMAPFPLDSLSMQAASFIASKSMGIVLPDTEAPVYETLRYSSHETIPYVRWKQWTTGEAPFDPTVPPTDLSSRFHVTSRWEIAAEATNTNTGQQTILYKCTGTYSPRSTGDPVYADMYTQSLPLYIKRIKPQTQANMAKMYTLPWLLLSTCGWLAYEYDLSDIEEEVIVVPRPTAPGTWVPEATDEQGNCTFAWGQNNESQFVVPRQPVDTVLAAYGTARFISANRSDGSCTWGFTPDTNIVYDQEACFPFFCGLTPQNQMMGTTDTKKAQIKNYPAYSPTSDRNEILMPGESVAYTIKTIELQYQVKKTLVDPDYVDPVPEGEEPPAPPVYVPYTCEWKYAEIVPPDVYHTELSGTPYVRILDVTKQKPTTAEIEAEYISADDYWMRNWTYIDSAPDLKVPNHIYYAVLALTDNQVPSIREPYGAFNDCQNLANLGVFVKLDYNNYLYSCACRLDYIPYGYAVPSKTPSCFYKATAAENCAPRMKGIVYDIVRQDNELVLTAGCYIPCSTLTQM